jgi:hypothetical protein
MFCIFNEANKCKNANYSSTTEAREKMSKDMESITKTLNGTDVYVNGKPNVVFKGYKLEQKSLIRFCPGDNLRLGPIN